MTTAELLMGNSVGFEPNEKQMECIKQTEGPVMVLAGPGTGKTFTVTKRIKYMLEQGILPESILCLTYSETAATEMKTKLVAEVGSIGSAVTIHTYHAFCNDIIKHNPTDFDLLDGLSLADDITQQTTMSDAIKEYQPEFYVTRWGDSEFFVETLLKCVQEIKKSQITKEEYFYNLEHHSLWQGEMDRLEAEYKEREAKGKLVKTFLGNYETHKKKMGKAREAWEIYEIYDRLLKQRNFIDFDDMITMVLRVFDSNEELLKRVSKQYKYFLVDEYQDTNPAQNNIVFKLAEGAGNENIFVVGDDDQIIYEFQGAKTDTLAKFLKRYPNTKVICLKENNRSTQTILDFSYDVISQDKTRLEFNPEFSKYKIDKKLIAKNGKVCANDRKIKLHSFADVSQEFNYIVDDVERLSKTADFPKTEDGEPDLSSIAILTRNNAELDKFAELLRGKNIKYQIKVTRSIFDMKPSLLIYFYLKALYNNHYYAEKLFGLLGSEPFAFDAEDYSFLLSENRKNGKDFVENIRPNLNHEWNNKDKVLGFINTYDKLKELQSTESLRNLVFAVCNETGILDYYVKSDVNKVDNILAIKKIIEQADAVSRVVKGAGLGDFIDYLDTALARNIPINIDKDEYVQNAIQLVTLHSSKGRQFDYVYMPNLTASQWEKKRTKNDVSIPIIDEEKFYDNDEAKKSENLRLLFVGITRAKYDLTLSYSVSANQKGNEFTSYLANVIDNPDLIESENHELSREEYTTELFKSFSQTNYDYKGAFKDEIEKRVEKLVLSPSTLNSYLSCPRNFFYTYVLKVPVYDDNWNNANYGTAVHAVLENSGRMLLSEGKYPTKEEFLQEFESSFSKEEFQNDKDRELFHKRGLEKLGEYYSRFIETSENRLYDVEESFEAVPIDGEIVKGKIDRIERNADGTFGLFDYKTGAAKPHKKISDGGEYEHYLNQLRFYKLAYESKNAGAKVSTAGLIFVEESDKSYYTELTDEDNAIIKDKILSTYKNMRALNFEPCETENGCKYCSHKHLCKLNVL